MRRFVTCLFGLVLLPAALIAQSVPAFHPQESGQKGAGTACMEQLDKSGSGQCLLQARVWQAPIAAALACPVSMSARQSGGGSLVAVAPGQQPDRGPYQNIRLTMAPFQNGLQIAEATLRVHGLAPRVRAVPADSFANGPAEISRTLNLRFGEEEANERNAELVLRGFTSVSYIDLISITYTDGSAWTHGEQACRVAPDPIMLIGAR